MSSITVQERVPRERIASTASDAELIGAVRGGSASASAVLWQRHWRAAVRAASRLLTWSDAEDLASHAFLRVLETMRKGFGPDQSFRAYLLSTVRHSAYELVRRRVEIPFGFAEDLPAVDEIWPIGVDAQPIARAFTRLPERWRRALWLSEVEGLSVGEVGEKLGLGANAAAALTFRARAGLRNEWVVATVEPDLTCPTHATWIADHMVGYLRKSLRKREHERVEEHAEVCDGCSAALERAGRLFEAIEAKSKRQDRQQACAAR